MKKILIFSNPVNFINQIVDALSSHPKDLSISIILENKKIITKAAYSKVYSLHYSIHSLFFIIKTFPKLILFSFFSFSLLLLNCKQGLKSFKCLFEAYAYISKCQYIDLMDYDIYNIHFITIKKAILCLFLPKNKPIVISTWGSDIFRSNGIANNFWVSRAYKRANTIQVSTVEMAQCIYEKYGFYLHEKVKFARYMPEYKLVSLIQNLRNKKLIINDFKQRYNIPTNAICITIGNNGNFGNQHIKTLKSIEKVTIDNEICILLPLTYGLSKETENDIAQYMSNSKMNIICFKSYLDWRDLALLRICSDIFITMQITDALSGALTETLYAGNIGIAGSWLPYSTFRENEAKFITSPDFDRLIHIVEETILNAEAIKEKNKSNLKAIESFFFNKGLLISQWLSVFDI